MQRLNTFFLNKFRLRLRRPSPYVTLGELKTGVAELARNGALSGRQRNIITHILDMGSQPVSRLLTHRSQIVCVAAAAKACEVCEQLQQRAEVYCVVQKENRESEIIGFAYLSDILKAEADMPVGKIHVAADWVPDTVECAELISDMIEEGRSEVCAVDEFGAFEGVFSLNLALDKVLSASSESEKGREHPQNQSRIFDALAELEAIADWIPPSVRHLTREARTLNGLITNYLGKIPKTGEKFAIDMWTFYIIKARSNRIDKVLIKKRN
jgi:putative hemolysin